MDCKKAEKFLVEYFYRELSAKRTVEIEKHLEVCDRCPKTLESWQTIHTGFQKSVDPTASPYLKQRILVAAKEELARKPSLVEAVLVFVRPVLVVPVLILGLFALLYFGFLEQPEIAVAKKVAAPVELNQRDQLRSNAPLRQAESDKLRSLGYVAGGESERKLDEPGRRFQEQTSDVKKLSESSDEMVKREAAEYHTLKDQEKAKTPEPYQMSAPAAAEAPPTAEQPAAPELAKTQASKETPLRTSAEETKLGSSVSNVIVSGVAGSSFRQAQVLFQRNDLNAGWNYAQQAIGQDHAKSLAPEFHQAGIQYQTSRDYGKAILQYNLVLQNYPNYNYLEDVLLRLAESYAEIGRYEDARRVYQQVLKLSPHNKPASERLKELQKKEEAQEQLRSLGLEDQNR